MGWKFTIYTAVLGLAGLVAAAVALIAGRRRNAPGGLAFTVMMWAVAEWACTSALETASVGLGAKILWSQVSYLGSASVTVFFSIFVLRYSQHDKWLTPRNMVLLWAIPVATLAIAATNQWHHLVWTSFTSSPLSGSNLIIYGHGVWFWVAVSYDLVLVFAGTLLLANQAVHSGRTYRRQAAAMLIAAAVPWIGSIVYITDLSPIPGLELPPVTFTLTGVILAWGMFRLHLLDLVPVARDRLVEGMADGVLVLDMQDRVVDINPAAQRLIHCLAPSPIGQHAETLVPMWPDLVARRKNVSETHLEIPLGTEALRYLDLRASPLHDTRQRADGWLIVLRDITARKLAEAEREKLIAELQQALGDVKTLRGLLPICASCKRIRDDQGYWKRLEEYIGEHSEAEFTHGICPECMAKLDPEFVKDTNRVDGRSS